MVTFDDKWATVTTEEDNDAEPRGRSDRRKLGGMEPLYGGRGYQYINKSSSTRLSYRLHRTSLLSFTQYFYNTSTQF